MTHHCSTSAIALHLLDELGELAEGQRDLAFGVRIGGRSSRAVLHAESNERACRLFKLSLPTGVEVTALCGNASVLLDGVVERFGPRYVVILLHLSRRHHIKRLTLVAEVVELVVERVDPARRTPDCL